MNIALDIALGLALVGMMWALAEIWQRAESRRKLREKEHRINECIAGYGDLEALYDAALQESRQKQRAAAAASEGAKSNP